MRSDSRSIELHSAQEAVEVALRLSQSWFRGQPKPYGKLVPRIFRDEFSDEILQAVKPDLELSMFESFRRAAPAILDKTPAADDYLSWLFVMQHHGTPTRLLDWTQSALAALYFAASESLDADGELWALYPVALNRKSNITGLPLSQSKVLRFLASEFAQTDRARYANRLGLKSVPKYPLAYAPPLLFPRMVAQRSVFTIHPKPSNGGSIPDLLPEAKHLVRYSIPAKRKAGILLELRFLGITRGTLFPDLEGLSRSVIDEHKTVGYSPPEPPSWGHENGHGPRRAR